MDARVILGLFLVAVGVLIVLTNKRSGHLFRTWNTGFLISPELGAQQYRADASGRVWRIIVVGAFFVVVGVAVTISGLV
jgi:hypothetical protein